MTKKDFELIARIISELETEGGKLTPEDVAIAFAEALKAANPKFDRQRFLAACASDE